MSKAKHVWVIILWTLLACGPDTIFVRPGLDTPFQHVANGNMLLEQGKANDALREFERAIELDPRFCEAYIGVGIVYGRRGDLDAGFKQMQRAKSLAKTDNELDKVMDGFQQLRKMAKE